MHRHREMGRLDDPLAQSLFQIRVHSSEPFRQLERLKHSACQRRAASLVERISRKIIVFNTRSLQNTRAVPAAARNSRRVFAVFFALQTKHPKCIQVFDDGLRTRTIGATFAMD
jgi:hypothetical protein